MLDPNAMRTFVLAAELRNFSAVAAERNTVQSAVSAQIRNLERSLGKTLISRGRGRCMSLTPEGEAFLVYARRLLALSEEAIETVRTAQSRHVIRLGTTVTLAMSVVPDVLTAFAKVCSDVQIQIQCDRSDALLRYLSKGDVDAVFMMDQGRHASRAFVHSQPLVWVCSAEYVMPETGPVPLAFLTDGRDLRRYALNALDEAGLNSAVSHLSPHPIGVRAFVQSGLALTVMPKRTVAPPLIIAPDDLDLPALAGVALAAYSADGSSEMRILLEMLEAASVTPETQ